MTHQTNTAQRRYRSAHDPLQLLIVVGLFAVLWALKTIATGFLTRLGELLGEDFHRWLLRR